MSGQGHILIEGETLTLARRLPIRWDVRCEAHLAGEHLSRRRLALQIRQDIWRACQNVRGFTPLVSVTPVEAGYQVAAGGMVAVQHFPRSSIVARLEDVLSCSENQRRWRGFAAQRRSAA